VYISSGGGCFVTEEEIKQDTILAIELESNLFPAPILALARVDRCKGTRHGYEIGCEY